MSTPPSTPRPAAALTAAPTTRRAFMGGVAALGALTLAACGGGSSSSGGGIGGTPEGEILVLTNRTDLVKTVFADYAKKFQAEHPDVTVKFQALTDYEGEVKTRMNTKQYGDVLLIPSAVAQKDYPAFFEPLGDAATLAKKYSFVDKAAVGGKAYGMATFGNATGTVYNKDVFSRAGMSAPPTSPDELIALLQQIKAGGTATPYYTNYKDGWPLTWPQNFLGSVSGDEDAGAAMAGEDAPWTSGKEKYALDSLLYDMVRAGVTESDPTTTNWESSKTLIASGEIGMMPLGSWALPQMKDAARTAGSDPASIGFMPAPFQVGGTFISPTGPDYMQAINVNSEHKAAANAWITWMTEESGYYDYAGGLPTLTSDPVPAALEELQDAGVTFLAMNPSAELDAVDKGSEVGITQPDYYRTLVDSARGASSTSKDDIFETLNDTWAAARQDVG